MQPFVHHQHDGVVKIKYREELRSRYAKFVYCVIITVLYVNAMCRDVVITKQVGFLSQKSRKMRVFVWKNIPKITPLSSKLHVNISCRLSSQRKEGE